MSAARSVATPPGPPAAPLPTDNCEVNRHGCVMGVSWQAFPAPMSDRQTHLSALRAVLVLRPELACGVVERRGAPAGLSVVWRGRPQRLVEVGCDFFEGAWWFTWGDGRRITPVSDVEYAVALVVRELARS